MKTEKKKRFGDIVVSTHDRASWAVAALVFVWIWFNRSAQTGTVCEAAQGKNVHEWGRSHVSV